MQKINIGVVGLGMGENHLSACIGIPEVNVIAIADANKDKLKTFAQKYGIRNSFLDYRQLLELKELDAVCICLPNYLHAPTSIYAFESGKHVLCEKPPARNAKEVESMVKSARKSKKKLMFAFNQRFSEFANVLKKFIEDGELGEIYYAKAGWLRRRRVSWKWFADKKRLVADRL